jgi:hypothetical protein
MDYETKFILERLIRAVESPDGWTIALTAINTIAVIVIAIIQIRIQNQQTKLQKRQVKQQDYEFNKELLMLIKSLDKQIIDFTFNLFNATDLKSYGINRLSNIMEHLKVLDDKLLNVAIDFEVRFPNEKMIVSDYRNMIISMYMMCRKFIKYISDDIVNTKIELDIDVELNIRKTHNDETFKNGILLHVEDKVVYNDLSEMINKFIQMKISILNKKYSYIIAKPCKID